MRAQDERGCREVKAAGRHVRGAGVGGRGGALVLDVLFSLCFLMFEFLVAPRLAEPSRNIVEIESNEVEYSTLFRLYFDSIWGKLTKITENNEIRE